MCKISGKIEFSHHGFVMAFSYAESEEKPRARRGEHLRIENCYNILACMDWQKNLFFAQAPFHIAY